MAKKVIDAEFKFPNWAKKIQGEFDRLMLEVVATIQTNRAMLFDQEGAYNGHTRWAPLKRRKGQILSDTGALRRSLAPTPANGRAGPGGIVKLKGDVVTIGTTIAYAAIHNYGGTIKHPGSKNAFGVKGRKTKAHKITIPKRPFLDGAWNEQDQAEVEATLKNKVARLMGITL